jgi:UDPglucose 6-dehydrogenase
MVVTAHKQYSELDFENVQELMKHPVIIDGRDQFAKTELEKAGFVYRGVGKG